jgi:hypothetical protein
VVEGEIRKNELSLRGKTPDWVVKPANLALSRRALRDDPELSTTDNATTFKYFGRVQARLKYRTSSIYDKGL